MVGLTQEDTAEHMHLSVSSVQRIQREAIHALALHIWDATKARQPSLAVAPVETPSLDQSSSDAQNVSWRSQMHRDLASLHDGAASVRANVGDMIHTVITLEQALTSSRGITLVPGAIRASLMVAVHPSVLRQILVMSIGRLVDQMAHGSIRIDAQDSGGQVQLLLTCEPPATVIGVNWGPVCEILATEGSSLEVAEEATCSSVRIELPRAGDVVVLVVDDNPDMLYLYRRCVKRTNYRIIHEHSAQCLFESVQQHAPEVIILDIMLPDVDGWQLLSDLHHHHTTHRIPIIVCSVIGEEDLALALGASLFLHKPVDCRSFIQALDRILRPAPLVAATKPASTAATG